MLTLPEIQTLLRRFTAGLIAVTVALAASQALAQGPADEADSAEASDTGSKEKKDEPSKAAKKDEPSKEALKEARARYERAKELHAEGNYQLAIIEFQRAYELAPAFRILYNIGLVNVQLGRYADALRAFNRFLDEGGDRVSPELRETVDREIASLEFRTAKLEVITNVQGAEILVDETPVGTTPLDEPVLVDAGRHKVEARKSGHIPDSKVLTLAGSDVMTLEMELEPRSTGGGTTTVIREGKTSYVWVGWVATAALVAGTTGTGIAAVSAERSLKDERNTATTQESLEDRQSDMRTLAIVTDVLAGASVVAGAVTLYFTIDEALEGDEEGADEAPESAQLRVGVGPLGVVLNGSF